MKNFKRLAVILLVVSALAIVGCGKKGKDAGKGGTSDAKMTEVGKFIKSYEKAANDICGMQDELKKAKGMSKLKFIGKIAKSMKDLQKYDTKKMLEKASADEKKKIEEIKNKLMACSKKMKK